MLCKVKRSKLVKLCVLSQIDLSHLFFQQGFGRVGKGLLKEIR